MTIRLFVAFLFLVAPPLANAQEDICCVLGKKTDQSAVTMAMVRSIDNCKAGKEYNGYKTCSAKPDPNNDCPMITAKERCQACNFFWAGETCLPEDPVEKAKAELKAEEKAKKAKEKK